MVFQAIPINKLIQFRLCGFIITYITVYLHAIGIYLVQIMSIFYM